MTTRLLPLLALALLGLGCAKAETAPPPAAKSAGEPKAPPVPNAYTK